MAESFKYVGDLNGSSQPVLLRVPLDNSEIHLGDLLTICETGGTDGYGAVAVAGKSALGVVMGFTNKDGSPLTPSNAGGNTVTPTSGGVAVESVTASSDGAACALVSVSPTAVYSVPGTTAPVATTQYIGGAADVVCTTGAQTVALPTAGTWSTGQVICIPWNSTTGIDANDATRLTVVLKESELFGVIATS